jgi:hypothetical protein
MRLAEGLDKGLLTRVRLDDFTEMLTKAPCGLVSTPGPAAAALGAIKVYSDIQVCRFTLNRLFGIMRCLQGYRQQRTESLEHCKLFTKDN